MRSKLFPRAPNRETDGGNNSCTRDGDKTACCNGVLIDFRSSSSCTRSNGFVARSPTRADLIYLRFRSLRYVSVLQMTGVVWKFLVVDQPERSSALSPAGNDKTRRAVKPIESASSPREGDEHSSCGFYARNQVNVQFLVRRRLTRDSPVSQRSGPRRGRD
jgi:hypothetical protein